mmetsp:Transcript_68833/g.199346  ORF Transcript_68833/g.199346 Transcript_68833/m.199346 type:complete len:110 (-) Transcript_68833:394-723(-)
MTCSGYGLRAPGDHQGDARSARRRPVAYRHGVSSLGGVLAAKVSSRSCAPSGSVTMPASVMPPGVETSGEAPSSVVDADGVCAPLCNLLIDGPRLLWAAAYAPAMVAAR